MRAGQAATVEIDTYGDKTFKAHVASLSPGTGAQFSVLPAQNATGNWVKVVQRLAVRIEIDDADRAHPLLRRPQRHREGRHAGSEGRARSRIEDTRRAARTAATCERVAESSAGELNGRGCHSRSAAATGPVQTAQSGTDHRQRDGGVDHAGDRHHDRR